MNGHKNIHLDEIEKNVPVLFGKFPHPLPPISFQIPFSSSKVTLAIGQYIFPLFQIINTHRVASYDNSYM